jgi:hypothetical protein
MYIKYMIILEYYNSIYIGYMIIHTVCGYTNFYILVLRYNYNILKNKSAFEVFLIYPFEVS